MTALNTVGRIAGLDADEYPRPQISIPIVEHLSIPLTPSRAAALAAFEVRHNVHREALILDLLDDVIFDRGSA